MRFLAGIKAKSEELLEHQGFQRYAANTGWMFGVQMLRMLSGLLVGVWVARFLGPEKYGVLNYALAFVAVFSSAAKLGLDNVVIRDLVKTPEMRDAYLGTAFRLKYGAALIAYIIAIIAAITAKNDFNTCVYICIIGAGLIFQPFEVVDFYFQSKVLSKYVSFCKTVQLGVSALIKIGLILYRADLVCFVLVILIDQVVMAVSYSVAYKHQRNGSYYGHFNPIIAKQLMVDSWPLLLNGIAFTAHMRVGQLMIKALLGPGAVGVYTAAIRLSEGWYFIPLIITSSLFPAIVNARKNSNVVYYRRIRRLLGLMAWLSIAVALLTMSASEWLIRMLYGNAYAGAAPVLRIYVWAGVFFNLTVVSAKWLINENYQQIILFRTLLGAVVNIILSLVLIPRYSISGAAYAAVVSYAIVGLLYDLLDPRMRGMFRLKTQAFITRFWRI